MELESIMASQLIRTFIDSDWQIGTADRRLRQTFDRNFLTGSQVLGQKHHSKGAMIERSNGLESTIEELTLSEMISHTLHFQQAESVIGIGRPLPVENEKGKQQKLFLELVRIDGESSALYSTV